MVPEALHGTASCCKAGDAIQIARVRLALTSR
jgi:hypothetical protein